MILLVYRWCATSTGAVGVEISDETSGAEYYFFGAELLAGSRHFNLHLDGLPTDIVTCVDDL